jgi:hypothetical protein
MLNDIQFLIRVSGYVLILALYESLGEKIHGRI